MPPGSTAKAARAVPWKGAAMLELLRFRFWIAAKLILFVAGAAFMFQAGPSLVGATGSPTTPASRADVTIPLSQPEPTATPTPAPTASLSNIHVTRELEIPHWLQPGEFVWNDESAPATGPTVIVVNIRARVLSVYRAGVEIGRSSLIYGGDNKPTPLGTFPILEKDADHWSNLYDAPMPHMLRLTWDGVALHGSPALADNLVTRGCVGLPREFAAKLFGAVRVGDQVVVWDGVTSA